MLGIKCCVLNSVDSESERILTIGPSLGLFLGWEGLVGGDKVVGQK